MTIKITGPGLCRKCQNQKLIPARMSQKMQVVCKDGFTVRNTGYCAKFIEAAQEGKAGEGTE